jgi:hypothetical protein
MKRIIFVLLVLLTTNLFALEVDLGGKLGMGAGWWDGKDYTKHADSIGAPNFNFGAYTANETNLNVGYSYTFK